MIFKLLIKMVVIIIDKEGHVVKRLAPKDSPKKAESLIQNLL